MDKQYHYSINYRLTCPLATQKPVWEVYATGITHANAVRFLEDKLAEWDREGVILHTSSPAYIKGYWNSGFIVEYLIEPC